MVFFFNSLEGIFFFFLLMKSIFSHVSFACQLVVIMSSELLEYI